MEWRWGNEHRLTHALGLIENDDEVDDLLDALDAVLADPGAPELIVSYPMRGTSDHVDRIIAELPTAGC